MKEAIAYIFVNKDQILIEHRHIDEEKSVVILVPGGGIDAIDHEQGRDYKESAMLREVDEELQHQVKPLTYAYVGNVMWKQRRIPFYVFVITEWEGKIPDYIFEDGEPEGKLEWLQIDTILEKTSNQITVDSVPLVKTYLTSIRS